MMPTELLLYFNDVLVYLICLIKMLSRARLTHRREEVLCQTMQGWTQSGAKCTRVKKPVAEGVGCCKWLPSPSWVKGLWSRPFSRNFFELLSQNCALLRTMFMVCILEGCRKISWSASVSGRPSSKIVVDTSNPDRPITTPLGPYHPGPR